MYFSVSLSFNASVSNTAFILWYEVAMLHHPDIMKKAQAEIDKIVGRDRLPQFEDAESLLYVKALVLETMRLVNR